MNITMIDPNMGDELTLTLTSEGVIATVISEDEVVFTASCTWDELFSEKEQTR